MAQDFPDRQVELLNVRFSDSEHLRESVQAWDLDFKPLSAQQKTKEIAHIQQFVIGGIDHGYSRILTAVDQSGAPPPGKLTFTILGKNVRQLWWRGHHVDAGDVLVFPRNSELRCFSGSDFENHALSVGNDILARICERNELPFPATSDLGEVFRPPSEVLDLLRGRLHGLRTGKTPASSADYVPVIEQLVVEWNLNTGWARTGNIRGIRNRDRAMRMCLDVIAQCDLVDIAPSFLCDLAGVSARTLEYAFKERFDIGPAAFLKSLRLVAARQELLDSRPDGRTVGDVGAQFGFWHSGQFAKDYCTQFGENPSDTLGGTLSA